MFLLHELYRNIKSTYNTLLLWEHSSQFASNQGSLREMFIQARQAQTTKKALLLDEQRFSRFATPIAFCTTKPCTAQDMYLVIDPIINTYWWHHSEKLFYHIDSITVNWEEQDYYIGHTGDIRCVLHVIALQRDDWYIAKSVFGKDIEQVRMYPASFFTLHHIKHTLGKMQWTLLSIGQYHTKRIVFQNGMYKTCEVLDLWWQVLKDIYTENNIRDFFDAKINDVEGNTYAKWLVEQSVKFYVDMLLRWLRSYQTTWDIFLVSDIIHNEFFMDMFSRSYQDFSQAFIVPINNVKWLKTYGRNRWPEEIDMQTAAHYIV